MKFTLTGSTLTCVFLQCESHEGRQCVETVLYLNTSSSSSCSVVSLIRITVWNFTRAGSTRQCFPSVRSQRRKGVCMETASFMLLLEERGSASSCSVVSPINLSQGVERTLSCSANHTEGRNRMHGDSFILEHLDCSASFQ